MTTPDFATLSTRLVAALKPVASPIAISFRSPGSAPVATRLEPNYPEPNDHGRTGQVPAGCVFWIQGTEETFSTEAADHGNCSVGSYTHGFITLEEAATKDDVGAVLESEGFLGNKHCNAIFFFGWTIDRPAGVEFIVNSSGDVVVFLRIICGCAREPDAFGFATFGGRHDFHLKFAQHKIGIKCAASTSVRQ